MASDTDDGTVPTGERVRITKGISKGVEGVVTGTDDEFGENVVNLDSGGEAIVPDDGLVVLDQ